VAPDPPRVDAEKLHGFVVFAAVRTGRDDIKRVICDGIVAGLEDFALIVSETEVLHCTHQIGASVRAINGVNDTELPGPGSGGLNWLATKSQHRVSTDW